MPAYLRQAGTTAELRELLHSRTGPVARDMYRRGLRVERRAKRKAPVDTGRLRSSIETRLALVATGIWGARVGTNVRYAIYVHDGTGLHGPKKTRITPTTSKVLVFTVKGTKIYARSVAGVPSRPFLRDALVEART